MEKQYGKIVIAMKNSYDAIIALYRAECLGCRTVAEMVKSEKEKFDAFIEKMQVSDEIKEALYKDNKDLYRQTAKAL